VKTLQAFRRLGVLGINRRNAGYTLRWNDRSFYPRVDDKRETKRLCERAGIPTPRLLATAEHHFELRDLPGRLADLSSFVLKPARGALGNGIMVVVERDGERLLRAGGRWVRTSDLVYHAASIISGLYSLSGQVDAAIVEERLIVHPELAEIASDGVPDVRVVVYRGVPVMAMTRLPTRRSGGRANLHQGAVGAGVDLVSGRVTHAVLYTQPIRRHPDTGLPLIGRQIPQFEAVLEYAVAASDQTELGYVGADVVVDAVQGAMILELNARPGLAVQLANSAGLLPRIAAVDADWQPGLPVSTRVDRGRSIARARVSA
jgi:alpha-L-glutamate ligase-like protein